MEFKVEAGSVPTRKFLEAILPSMISQLSLTNSRRAVLVKVTDDISAGMEGSTQYVEWADCYLILIRRPKRVTKASLLSVALTMAHEMVHVQQLAKGTMKLLAGETRIWRGKRYTKKTKYLQMPWEIQAFQKQELLLRRAIEV